MSHTRSLRSTAATAVLAGAVLGAAACGDAEREGEVAPARTAERRVMLFALDGVTWRILDPLIEAGELPHLARLIEGGVSGPLRTLVPSHSPTVWTSVATGKSEEKHGILDFWYEMSAEEAARSSEESDYIERLEALGYTGDDPELASSKKALYHSGKRTARTLWQILGDHGYSSDVIGWWMSYPAEAIRGRMITDRYVYNRFELAASEKGRVYEDDGSTVFPPELRRVTDPLVVKVPDLTEEDLGRFVEGDVRAPDELVLNGMEDELAIVYAKDRSFVQIGRTLLDESVPDLFAIYLQGTDITGHFFWKFRFPKEWDRIVPDEPVEASELERYAGVVDGYMRVVDAWLGELIERAERAGGETTFVVLSDHGMETGQRKGAGGVPLETISGVHTRSSPPGVLILSGSGIRAGASLEDAHVYDVMPTLLALYGLPPAADLDGRVLTEALAPGVLADLESQPPVASYEDAVD